MNRTHLHDRAAGTAQRVIAGAVLMMAVALAPAAALAQTTYTWNVGPGYSAWSDPNSWSPVRALPATNDILVFTGAGTSEVDVDVAETIGQFVVSSNHTVKLGTNTGALTITVGGGTGLDFRVESGCTLELDGSLFGTALRIALATGTTGQVDGSAVVISTMGGGQLLATDAGSLHFLSGSRFEANPFHTGSAFGTTGTAGTVVFEGGAMYVARSGANPFGLAAPNSKVNFQSGSVYRQEGGNAPALSNRTYPDFEWATTGATTAGGTMVWTVDNMRFISGTLNITANQPILVKKDITVSSGAAFNYTPTAATMTFGGTSTQSVSCPNNVELGITGLNLGAGATVTTSVGHPGLSVTAGDLNPLGTFTPQVKVTCSGTGRVIMGPSATLTPAASAWIDGPLGRRVATGATVVSFPVGHASARSDVTLSFANVSTAGYEIVQTFAGDHAALSGSGLDPLKSVNRWWRVQPGTGGIAGPVFTTTSATLDYTAGETDGGATPSNFIVGKRDGGAWTLPTHTVGSATSIQATGLTSFSEFAVAEPSSCPLITVLPASLPGGTTGVPYSETLTGSGGTAPYTFAVTFGSLPPGLTLAAGGALTGTPAAAGTYNFSVTGTDNVGCAGATSYSVSIAGACPTITLSPMSLPNGFAGLAYGQTITASGGSGPYTFALTAGTLPPGLTLSSAGGLTGTPTTTGTFNFTVTATDANTCTGDRAYSLTIQCPTITLFPTVGIGGTVGVAYSVTHTASGGTGPYTFAVTAGALPPGLTLASGGALTGTPTVPGPYNFTVTATDALGCTGSRAYTVNIACPTITIAPAFMPDGVQGTSYSMTFTASGGTGPYSFSFGGSMPTGLTFWTSGAVTGTPTQGGVFNLSVTATDANGCFVTAPRTLTIVPGNVIAPVAPATCIANATPCVMVPIAYTRVNTTPALAYSVTVTLSPELTICGPGFTSAGYLPAGAGGTAFLSTPVLSNTWTVDESTLGPPCGATGSGTLFYVHVASSTPGATATGTITVVGSTVRDCSNAPIPAVPGDPITVNIDLSAPAQVTNLAAVQQKTGNDADGTTRVTVSFTGPPDATTTQVWRKGFGGYPQYDENGGIAPTPPASPAAAASAGWTLTPVTVSGQADEPPTRDFWTYVVFSLDGCGNTSAVSNATGGTLNYHLGDTHNSVVACAGDNAVGTADVSFLGAHYFAPIPVNDPLECLDVGPTTNLSPDARPTTDNVLNFEDLILLGINYGQVSAPAFAARPAVVEGATNALAVDAPAQVRAGERVRALVRLQGAGDLQGLSARLGWNAAIVAPRGFESGGWLEADGGVVFEAGPGGVDAALLGLRGRGISGEGTLAIVTFEARATGAPGIRILEAEGRDPANRRVSLRVAPGDATAALPSRTAIDLAFPNPFAQQTSVQLSLARTGHVKLAAFDLGGRLVRTLVDGNLEAGRHSVTWDGRSDAGAQLAPGAYVVRLETGEVVQSRRISIVR